MTWCVTLLAVWVVPHLIASGTLADVFSGLGLASKSISDFSVADPVEALPRPADSASKRRAARLLSLQRRIYSEGLPWIHSSVGNSSSTENQQQTLPIVWGKQASDWALHKHFVHVGVRSDQKGKVHHHSKSTFRCSCLPASLILAGLLFSSGLLGATAGYLRSDLLWPAFQTEQFRRCVPIAYGSTVILFARISARGSGQGGYAGVRVGEASNPGPLQDPGTPLGGERPRRSPRSSPRRQWRQRQQTDNSMLEEARFLHNAVIDRRSLDATFEQCDLAATTGLSQPTENLSLGGDIGEPSTSAPQPDGTGTTLVTLTASQHASGAGSAEDARPLPTTQTHPPGFVRGGSLVTGENWQASVSRSEQSSVHGGEHVAVPAPPAPTLEPRPAPVRAQAPAQSASVVYHFCPVPGCPQADRTRARGWVTIQSVRNHVEQHRAGRLQGTLPQEWLDQHRLTPCSDCGRLVVGRPGAVHPTCHPRARQQRTEPGLPSPDIDMRPDPQADSLPTLDEISSKRTTTTRHVPKIVGLSGAQS